MKTLTVFNNKNVIAFSFVPVLPDTVLSKDQQNVNIIFEDNSAVVIKYAELIAQIQATINQQSEVNARLIDLQNLSKAMNLNLQITQ